MSTKTNKGFTVIELLVYTAGMVILLIAISTILFYFYDWYRLTTAPARADRVGVALVDRIVKDIRTGTSINLGQSQLNTPTGSLSITAHVSGADVTKYFEVINERVHYSENGSAAIQLSPGPLSVSRFYFAQITTPISQAIRVEVDITFNTKDGTETRSYNGVAILRHFYE